MQNENQIWDVAVIGGGLAGLSAAIQLAQKGFSVLLLEKEQYPYHKVCGEYISMESWNFLQSLGVPLQSMQLPLINTLVLTAPNGKRLQTLLPLGGFGISRFTLDSQLAQMAMQSGVTLLENARADEVVQEDKTSQISFTQNGIAQHVKAKIVAGAFGKRSNLDVKWKRPFISNLTPGHNNYIGIKYHIKTDWPQHIIGLHNFKDGYCGISKVEGDKYCLCYLTTAKNLKANGNSMEALQQNVLSRNPHLKNIFANSSVAEGFPISIAQISFSKKAQVENGVLMLGDAAGMITPLCGNGMSMALHSSKIAAALIESFLKGQITRQQLEQFYTQQWQQAFGSRMATGRLLQRFFGHEALSNWLVQTFRAVPFLAGSLIKKTHGKPF
ncbi:MAG: NAD(P)/FAD-dependent oxidoreductase [Chitinophagaceae bacterium]